MAIYIALAALAAGSVAAVAGLADTTARTHVTAALEPATRPKLAASLGAPQAAVAPGRAPETVVAARNPADAAATTAHSESAVPTGARAQAARLVALGDACMAQGNVGTARQYFLRAVNLGLAVATLRLAETYDPNELARPSVLGVKPNPAEARRWYQRAVELDVPGAVARMQRLGAR